MSQAFTLIDDGRVLETEAVISRDRVTLAGGASVLGWEWKDEGLCRGEVCVPVRDPAALGTADGVDLEGLAVLLGRPLALDVGGRAAALAAAPADRSTQLASLEAPDFTLPDLDGKLHSLSDQRGKKVLLVAYASW